LKYITGAPETSQIFSIIRCRLHGFLDFMRQRPNLDGRVPLNSPQPGIRAGRQAENRAPRRSLGLGEPFQFGLKWWSQQTDAGD
jgi:hypothetical protein